MNCANMLQESSWDYLKLHVNDLQWYIYHGEVYVLPYIFLEKIQKQYLCTVIF